MTGDFVMPLQNRVDPFGELFVTPARGLFMGNRGGRIHTDDRKLTKRRWVSPQWICCKLEFNNRHRDVWGRRLHRTVLPRRGHGARRRPPALLRMPPQGRRGFRRPLGADAQAAGAARWRRTWTRCCRPNGSTATPSGVHRRKIDRLPDGAIIALEGEGAFAVRGGALLHWTPSGYDARKLGRAELGRCADAAVDPVGARRRLPAAMAPER